MLKLTAWELVLMEELVRERLNGASEGNYRDSLATLLDKVANAKPAKRA
jgi:hypothetical protein